MSIQIQQIPFFNAVLLFEAENFQEAYQIFIKCAKNGNLYSLFYLKHLIDNCDIKKNPEDESVLKNLEETLEKIPRTGSPESWRNASLKIIECKHQEKIGDEEEVSLCLKSLNEKVHTAPNALVYLFTKYSQMPEGDKKDKKLRELLKTAHQFPDLLTHIALQDQFKKNNSEQIKNVSFDLELIELQHLEQHKALACLPKQGLIEQLFAKKIDYSNRKKRGDHWSLKSAYLGNPERQNYMFKIEKTEESKLYWLRTSAENHWPISFLELGIRLFMDKQSEKILDQVQYYLEKGLALISKDEKNKDILSLLPIAKKILATAYHQGVNQCPENREKAMQLYQDCLAQTSSTDSKEAGKKSFDEIIFRNKNILEKNTLAYKYIQPGPNFHPEKAYQSFAEAAKLGDTHAAMNVAWAKMNGIGVKQDVKAALKEICALKEAGKSVDYLLCLASESVPEELLLSEGITLKKREGWLKESIDNGQPLHSSLARLYLYKLPTTENIKTAYQLLQKGIEIRDPSSIKVMGEFYAYDHPELKMKANPVKKFEFYKQAADLDEINAIKEVGICYLEGDGVEQDYTKARKYLIKALALGNLYAATSLYNIYYKGLGVTKNKKRALEYLITLENNDSIFALRNLAYHFCKGVDITADIGRGIQCLKRGTEMGSIECAEFYAYYVLKQHIQKGSINEGELKEILLALEIPVARGYSRCIFLNCMMKLLLDSTQLKAVKEELQISLKNKHHKRTKEALEYLKDRESVTNTELFVLTMTTLPPEEILEGCYEFIKMSSFKTNEVTGKEDSFIPASTGSDLIALHYISNKISDPIIIKCNSEENKDKIEELAATLRESFKRAGATNEVIVKDNFGTHKNHSSSTNKNSTNKKQESSNGPKGKEKNNNEQKIASSKQKLEDNLEWFTDRRNIKQINLQKFNSLLTRFEKFGLMNDPDFEIEMKPGKGSAVKYSSSFHSNEGKSESLHFTYHPTHSSDQGRDTTKDRGRAKDLQDFAKRLGSAVKP